MKPENTHCYSEKKIGVRTSNKMGCHGRSCSVQVRIAPPATDTPLVFPSSDFAVFTPLSKGPKVPLAMPGLRSELHSVSVHRGGGCVMRTGGENVRAHSSGQFGVL